MIGPFASSLALLASPAPLLPEDPYFPPALAETMIDCGNSFGNPRMPVLSSFESDWFSTHLRAAGEPSLFRAAETPPAGDGFVLRFTWLRSFHPPVVVRVEPSAGGFRLIAKQLSGAGGYDPGTVAKTVDRQMTAAETQALRTAMTANAIFAQPPADCALGLDGARWIVEGIDRDGYHFTNRFSPEKGPVRAIGLHLIGLTGWRFNDVY